MSSPLRLLRATAALASIALLLASAAIAQTAQYVIHISVDGLNATELKNLIDNDLSGDYANFQRLLDEGTSTFNARTDYTHTITLPNHTSMITGRPVSQPAGQANTVHHGYTSNGDPGPSDTLHNSGNPNLAYVDSALGVAHDYGLSTALYASKSKFVLFDQSYDASNGAPDLTGADDGPDKIDTYVQKSTGSPSNASNMHADFLVDMAANRFNYAWVNYRDPDSAGHASGWGSTAWDDSVADVDDYLGDILSLIEGDVLLDGNTVVILTTDHGGAGTGHGDASNASNYTIPFLVWGDDIPGGTDLYALNAATRLDPGTGRPDHDAPVQPIRNGDSGNLALSLLGLPAVGGSTINGSQDLVVTASSAFDEDFESGFTAGATIGTHPDWFDEAAGPVVTAAAGTAGSVGLAPGTDVFIWTAHPFDWNASALVGVSASMDFQTSPTGQFDDDRVGWTFSDDAVASSNVFGVQLDPGGGGASGLNIEGYWDGVAPDLRPSIVDLPVLSSDTWYRLEALFTKLSATSARIDVTLTELDGNGDPVGAPVASGSIADTSLLGADAPDAKYFTPTSQWAAFKNFDAIGGGADNAHLEILIAQHTLSLSTVGRGSISRDPSKVVYDLGEDVTLTAVPDPGEAFLGWSGDLTGTENPAVVTISDELSITGTFSGAPQAGDIIIAGFQSWNSPAGQNPGEMIELFNTTPRAISLEGLEIISRTDNDANGSLDVDWQLANASPDLSGVEMMPYSFYLIGESGVAGAPDLTVDMDLATGEGGSLERAIGIQVLVDGVHMDHVLYGRDDGSDTGANPAGDLDPFTFPRAEVIRNTRGTTSFQEGVIQRISPADLYAGHDVDGYYTDEGSLAGSNPAGVWTSPHDETDGGYTPRSSASDPVPPSGVSIKTYVGSAGTEFVASGASGTPWRWYDQITYPSTAYPPPDAELDAWNEPDFDDSGWGTGTGIFGYGDLNGQTPNTTFTSGNITYLLRTTFDVSAIPDSLTARVLRDDGFILYLNGVEVARDNLTDPVDANTFTDTTIGGAGESAFNTHVLDPNDLVIGTNTLAVEVHNRDQTSSDLGFDMELEGSGTGWRYYDAITFPSTAYPPDDGEGDAWNEASYDDAGWATGSGLFGYGVLAGDAPDTVFENGQGGGACASGTPCNITYLLRSTFEATSLPDDLTAKIRRDDGFILYLNGQEVARQYLADPVDANTFASVIVGGAEEGQIFHYPIEPTDLVYGTNTIAVELHNRDETSTDIGFEMDLVGSGTFPAAVCGNAFVEPGEQCDDGNAVGGDCCDASCQFEAIASACDDGDACTNADTCDGAGSCDPGPPLVCDDGLICNGAESCDSGSGCVAGTPPLTDDGVACTDDACVEGLGVVNTPNDGNCDNGLACDGDETCDVLDDCQVGTPPDPDDGVACTVDSCVEPGGVQNDPDDLLCDDADPCTADACDEITGCSNTPIMGCPAPAQVPAAPGWALALIAAMLLAAGGLAFAGRREGLT